MSSTPELRRLREDVRCFSKAVGCEIASWQAVCLRLERRTTTIVAPRQSGKSRSLAVLALWWASRRQRQRVLIVSAGEEASRRLLAATAAVAAASPLLAGSVVDENAGLLVLSNGSEIRSVPASERQVRGWSVDLLLIDEASQLDDEFVLSACFPTTAARPDARIVLASSPAASEGVFFDYAQRGERGSEHCSTFTWSLARAHWISEDVVAAARETLPPAAFAREFLGEFSDLGADEVLIPRAWVEAAQHRTLAPAREVVFAVDVARHGKDSSVGCSVRAGVVRVGWSLHGADLMAVAGRAAAMTGGPIWVDGVGAGGPAGPLSEPAGGGVVACPGDVPSRPGGS
jgi:hypothetical protein